MRTLFVAEWLTVLSGLALLVGPGKVAPPPPEGLILARQALVIAGPALALAMLAAGWSRLSPRRRAFAGCLAAAAAVELLLGLSLLA